MKFKPNFGSKKHPNADLWGEHLNFGVIKKTYHIWMNEETPKFRGL